MGFKLLAENKILSAIGLHSGTCIDPRLFDAFRYPPWYYIDERKIPNVNIEDDSCNEFDDCQAIDLVDSLLELFVSWTQYLYLQPVNYPEFKPRQTAINNCAFLP